MTERSLMERIVAILGVVVGTIVWVLRFLVSSLKDAIGKASASGQSTSQGQSSDEDDGAGVGERATQAASDLRARGEALGQTVASTARDKAAQAREAAEGLVNRGDDASGTGGDSAPEITHVERGNAGGIPEAPNYGSVTASDAGTEGTTGASGGGDGEEDRFATNPPNIDEPGGDTGDVYGNQAGVLLDRDLPDGGYAGQMMQESDIGIDRGDEFTGLAEAEEILPETEFDRSLDGGGRLSDDEIDDEDEPVVDDDEDEHIPAASRGWQGAGVDESVADDLYDDIGVTMSTDEIDYENDEVGESDDDGMHIVDSPDESFIEVESPAEPIGLEDEGGELAFDTEVGERRTFDADSFAADAYGNRVGGDAASGDVGPRISPDDVERDPEASRPDYEVTGVYDGSGVDEFERDEVAIDMLDDVGAMDTDTETAAESGSNEDAGASGSDETSSIAWASSAGVVDEDLTKPLSPDELQAGGADTDDTRAGQAGVTESDADWRDVASNVAEDLDREMGDSGVGSTGTTMSGAGQTAGAMTSDDAANDESGANEMTANSSEFRSGGTTAPEAGDNEDDRLSGDPSSQKRMGVGANPQFNEVLPDQAYQSSVGYESLQADKKQPNEVGNRTSGSTSQMAGAATTTGGSVTARPKSQPRGSVPAGAVRGDGSGTCPADYPIKGNANSRIYHRPSDTSYENTNPEFCFATEEDAKAAGFRARKA